MNPIFKNNATRNYSSKDLKGGYTGKHFSVLSVYLNEQRLSL